MEPSVESLNPRKRAARDLDSYSEDLVAKRACADASSASPHLTLLEELCDLEEEGDGVAMEAPLDSSTQEDLVAEMMKSLEKVIEESGESRGEGEVSTSNLCGLAPCEEASSGLDFTWNDEEIEEIAERPRRGSNNGKLENEEDFKEDAQIRQLLQASDDELGIPLSSSSSDIEESAFHEEWASLANESSAPANYFWLEAQFEDAPAALSKEVYEPLLLF